MHKPKVSVLMPVYNGADFLKEAIDSILQQTYTDFELIIINDGSTDESVKIIEAYDDKRIRLYSQKNRGLVETLNRGISLSRGNYIARHDCDDLSHNERFRLQVAYLDAHPEAVLVGSSYRIVDENGQRMGRFSAMLDDLTVRQDMLLRNPFGHGTIMMRRDSVKAVGGYSSVKYTEDYDLWWRLSKIGELANLPEELYDWRVVDSSMSHAGSTESNWKLINQLRSRIWKETNLSRVFGPEMAANFTRYANLDQKELSGQFFQLQLATIKVLGAQQMVKQRNLLLMKVFKSNPQYALRYLKLKEQDVIGDYHLDYLLHHKLI